MLHMNQGDGETSYARNSLIQNAEQKRMKPVIEASIDELLNVNNTLLPRKMVIADLGCSSGPNALVLVSTVVEAIHSQCIWLQRPPPEVFVFLNDLPDNDFNMVIKSLITLRQSDGPVVVTGVAPGSFYGRLFTSGSLHFVCSNNSLHWLSKAPNVLTMNQIPAYDIDEHVRRERLPMVLDAYRQQFRKDFTLFLGLRAKELVPQGQMVISIVGKRSDENGSKLFHFWEFIACVLRIMASEGLIDKAKYNSFYIPIHGPSSEEIREIIQEEGSFSIREILMNDYTSGVDRVLITPSWFANQMRAALEPIMVQHFGDVMDEFMRTAERHWSRKGIFQDELARLAMMCVSLTKA